MKKSSAWFMLTPGLVILFLFLAIPLLRVLFPSIFSGAYPFDAYVGFFQDEYYRKIFIRTVKIAVITTFVCMVGGIPTAYFISRCSKKWRGILLAASIFPMMTNSVIRSFAWINILGSNGIINKVLVGLGVVPKPLKLLYTDFSIIIGSVYLFLPLMIVTVAGVMENIDDDMMEAALSLGAARMEAFMKVIFPMSLPGIIVGGILVFTGTLTAYTTPQLLGGNSNMVMATLIYQRAMSVSDWTGASVIALIMIVVTLAVIRGFNARKNKLLTIWAVLVFAFLAIPLLIITVTAFGGGSAITFPIESFSLKWFANVFALKSFRRSFITSLEVAFLATFISLLVGIPAAYALARSGMKGRGLLKSIFLSPTIVPGIVIGFIMYQCLILTLRIPVFTGLLAGHFMVTLPYVIRVVGSSMEQFDFSIEEAAWSLGCPKTAAFFKVVLPNVTSGISSAFMLAFINSFNNIPVSMFLSGPGVSTFPSTLMNYIEYNYDPTVSAVSVLLMAATVIIMVIVDRTLGIAALAK